MSDKKAKSKIILSLLLLFCISTSGCADVSNAEQINIEKLNFELGIDCLEKNDYSQAIKYFGLVLQKNPKNLEARYNLSLAYKKSGLLEKSVEESDKIVKLMSDSGNFAPEKIDINKLRADNKILHNNELASDNFALYGKVKSQENDYIDMADMHFDSQQFDTAAEYYNLALHINPYNDYTYFKLGLSYIEKSDFIEAEPYIIRAAELSPQNPKYAYYKENVKKNITEKYANNVNLRETALNQVLEAKKKLSSKTLHYNADIDQGLDFPSEYKKKLFIDDENYTKPDLPDSGAVKAPTNTADNKAVKQGKDKNKKFKLNAGKTQQDADINIKQSGFTQGKSQELDYLDLGDLHYDNQEYEAAADYYNLALNLNSNNDYTYYKLARCYIDMKQYKSADNYIEKALELSSMNKKYLYFKNQISEKLNPTFDNTIAYNKSAEFSKNKQKISTTNSYKLNPKLSMILEDPNIKNNETLIDENDLEENKTIRIPSISAQKEIKNRKPKQEKQIGLKFPFKLSFSLPHIKTKTAEQKVAASAEKSKNINNKQQIAATPEVENITPSIYGKDMKYFEETVQENQSQYKIPDYQFEKPIKETPEEQVYTADYYNQKGVEYFEQDNLQKAENFFKKALELKPMYPKAYNNLANIEVKRGNFEQAILYNTQAIQIDPTYPQAYYNMALIYKKKNDFTNQMAYLDKAIEADSKFYEAYFARGTAYYNSGNYEQAKYNFKEVLKYKNDHYIASQNLGIIYANELNAKEAENYLKTAIRLNKNNPEPYYYLASIYQMTGRVFDAIENYRKTIALDSSNYKAYLSLSKSYELNDEVDMAIDALSEAIDLNQNNAEPYNYIGLLYLKKDKYIEAVKAFQKAIEINPRRSVYHYNLSQGYICLNMKSRAAVEFQKATETMPSSIQDYIDLSEIFYDRSMPSYSVKVLKEGIIAIPNNDYLYIELSRMYEKTGAVNSAKSTLNEYLLKKPNGTLSLLVKRKLADLEKTAQNQSEKAY